MSRGRVLYLQGRHEQACQELGRVLVDDPQDAEALAYLALCKLGLKSWREALEHSEAAVSSGPDDPFSHYARARVLLETNRVDEAERAILEALELDPREPDFWHLAGVCSLRGSRWQQAAERALKGLEIRPDDPDCLNLQSMALMQLGQLAEATRGLRDSLAEHPENPTTLANLGWSALHRGDRKAALESFQEALRLDPEHEYARRGLLEALRLRYPLYGLLLRFFLKMGSLTPGTRWMVVLGFYFGARFLRVLARQHEEWRPFIYPILGVYLAFVYLTWTARPLTNLFLRLNRYGRLVLNREEYRESNLVGGCLVGATLSGVAAVAGAGPVAAGATAVLLTLVFPLSAIYPCEEGWPRRAMLAVTAFMAGLGGLALILLAAKGSWVLLGACLLLLLPCQLLANYLASVEPKR
ncbi:MAG: tetratricopeptide repeat protein [Candidatus Eremiobacterota bacterium]